MNDLLLDLIDQIIERKAMIKSAPANITDHATWDKAKKKAEEEYSGDLPDDRFYAVVNHIYQNMGGEFKKKKAQKQVYIPDDILDEDLWKRSVVDIMESDYPDKANDDELLFTIRDRYKTLGGGTKAVEQPGVETKTAEKKRDDKHDCPKCGKKMKKAEGDKIKFQVKPGWSKFDCDCGYSRDWRDGAPIYQAKRQGNKLVFYENIYPLFSVDANDVDENHRQAFLHDDHADNILSQMSDKGAYSCVQSWFPDGKGLIAFHPAIKTALLGVPSREFNKIVDDINTEERKLTASAKTYLSQDEYGALITLASLKKEPWMKEVALRFAMLQKLGQVKSPWEATQDWWSEAGTVDENRHQLLTWLDPLSWSKGILDLLGTMVQGGAGVAADVAKSMMDKYGPKLQELMQSAGSAVEQGLTGGTSTGQPIQASKKENNIYFDPHDVIATLKLGPGYSIKRAQIPGRMDPTAATSPIEEGMGPGAGNPAAPPGGAGIPPAPDALLGEEQEGDLLAETEKKSDIVRAILDVLAVMVTNSETLTPEGVLSELKQALTDNDQYAELRGRLEERTQMKSEAEELDEIAEAEPLAQSPPEDSLAEQPITQAASKKENKKQAAGEMYRHRQDPKSVQKLPEHRIDPQQPQKAPTQWGRQQPDPQQMQQAPPGLVAAVLPGQTNIQVMDEQQAFAAGARIFRTNEEKQQYLSEQASGQQQQLPIQSEVNTPPQAKSAGKKELNQYSDYDRLQLENAQLKSKNERLLLERSARLRAPRAVKLARMCFDVGELGDGEEEILIKNATINLMKMEEPNFLEKEATIKRIHEKLQTGRNRRQALDKHFMALIPSADEKDALDFSGKRVDGPSKSYTWNRPPASLGILK